VVQRSPIGLQSHPKDRRGSRETSSHGVAREYARFPLLRHPLDWRLACLPYCVADFVHGRQEHQVDIPLSCQAFMVEKLRSRERVQQFGSGPTALNSRRRWRFLVLCRHRRGTGKGPGTYGRGDSATSHGGTLRHPAEGGEYPLRQPPGAWKRLSIHSTCPPWLEHAELCSVLPIG